MQFEVYIDMNNENALYTVSMLSAMLETQDGDYYNLIIPFVLHCIPKERGIEVNVDDVASRMKEFGFVDFPIKLTESLLDKLCKPWKDGKTYISKKRQFSKNKFFVSRIYDADQFDQNNRDMRAKIERILVAIQQYFENNFYFKKIELDVIKSKLLAFFEANGFTVIEKTFELGLIQKEKGSDSFEIAHFVLEEHKKHSTIFDDLCDVTKGFLTYKGLYYFLQNRKGDIAARFRNLTFYLDCSLVLDALNYDTDTDYTAVNELIRLIRRSGGNVCVYRHTVAEAAKLICAFANQPNNRNNFRLDNLASKNMTREIILAYADDIEGTLKRNVSIDTVDTPDYEDKSSYKYLLGEEEIITWLLKNRNKGRKNSEYEERYQYDAKSLLAICMLRKGFCPAHIEDARAMLVTQDLWLNRCLESLYPDKFSKEVPYAITDAELVSMLWLRDHKNETHIPSELLIANAHAATRVLPDVMKRATELANAMAESGAIPNDAALLVSSHQDFKKYLANCVNNDLNKVDQNAIRVAIERYIESVASDRIDAARKKAMDNAREEISAISAQNEEVQKAYIATISAKDDEISSLNRQIQQIEEDHIEENNLREKVLCERAEIQASRARGYVKKILMALSHTVGLVFIVICVIYGYKTIVQMIQTKQFDGMILVNTISLIVTIAIFFQKNSWIGKQISRISDSIYRRVYSFMVSERKEQ